MVVLRAALATLTNGSSGAEGGHERAGGASRRESGDRGLAAGAATTPEPSAGGTAPAAGPAPGRHRNRQGTRGPPDSPRGTAGGRPVRGRQLRGHPRLPVRGRVVRVRARCLH